MMTIAEITAWVLSHDCQTVNDYPYFSDTHYHHHAEFSNGDTLDHIAVGDTAETRINGVTVYRSQGGLTHA